MIERESLLEYARRNSIDPFWVENDYLQHIALMQLYQELSNEPIFKGGTALQKVYGLNRLSRDLDFNFSEKNSARMNQNLESVAKKMSSYYETSFNGPTKLKHGEGYTLMINGPSYKKTGRQHQLPITFNTEEKTDLKPIFKTINPGTIYNDPDLHVYSLLVMDEMEILAEKVRAVITRKVVEPRDFYDIWFMLNQKVNLDMDLAKKKIEFDRARFSISAFKNRLRSVKTNWDMDLKPLVKSLPAYNEVARYIISRFDSKL